MKLLVHTMELFGSYYGATRFILWCLVMGSYYRYYSIHFILSTTIAGLRLGHTGRALCDLDRGNETASEHVAVMYHALTLNRRLKNSITCLQLLQSLDSDEVCRRRLKWIIGDAHPVRKGHRNTSKRTKPEYSHEKHDKQPVNRAKHHKYTCTSTHKPKSTYMQAPKRCQTRTPC